MAYQTKNMFYCCWRKKNGLFSETFNDFSILCLCLDHTLIIFELNSKWNNFFRSSSIKLFLMFLLTPEWHRKYAIRIFLSKLIPLAIKTRTQHFYWSFYNDLRLQNLQWNQIFWNILQIFFCIVSKLTHK